MPVTITCPACEASLTVPETLVGKTLRCKKCGETFRAEDPDDRRPPESAGPAGDDEDEKPARPRRRPRDDNDEDRPARKAGKKRKKKESPVLYIVGLLAALTLAAGAIAYVVVTRPVADEAEKNEAFTPRTKAK